jgi:O-acetyl-ADP-ribose deacetylase (regulator of RNase III)
LVEKSLQKLIRSDHHGEMLVGDAEIIETENKQIPFCISAPTMRIGTTLDETTTNPYLAARAVFLLYKFGSFKYGEHQGKAVKDVISSIAFPGLGTGVGGVTYEACAFQVIKALKNIMMDEFVFPEHGQPKDEHHEMWQIDKPESCAYAQLEYVSSYLKERNPKAIVSLYSPDCKLVFQHERFGKDDLIDFYSKFFKNKGIEIECTKVTGKDEDLNIECSYTHSNGSGTTNIVYHKFKGGDWRIVSHEWN